jgi:hypothetical protein
LSTPLAVIASRTLRLTTALKFPLVREPAAVMGLPPQPAIRPASVADAVPASRASSLASRDG